MKCENAILDLEEMRRGGVGEGTYSILSSPLSSPSEKFFAFFLMFDLVDVKVYESVSLEGFTFTVVACFFRFDDLEDVLVVD